MQYDNWYISQGMFCADYKLDGIWKSKQLEIDSYDPKFKKLILKESDKNISIFLDLKKIDS